MRKRKPFIRFLVRALGYTYATGPFLHEVVSPQQPGSPGSAWKETTYKLTSVSYVQGPPFYFDFLGDA